jgi:hypothetical protein
MVLAIIPSTPDFHAINVVNFLPAEYRFLGV